MISRRVKWGVRIGLLGLIFLVSLLLTIPPVSSADKDGLLDINTATAYQLKSLPGIGDAYYRQIINGRPYERKDELVYKNIIPRATYDGIKYRIVAKQK